MTEIAGKTAFITGGASGIGFAIGNALIDAGARVILADIDAIGVEAAAETLRAKGGEALGIALDVTDEAQWVIAGKRARAFGPVRLLFSNAGVGGGSGVFESYDTDVWRWNYAVNTHAHLYACRTFLGGMKESGDAAHVILTSSLVAIVPPPISAAYISSKFAALGIAMALRNELAQTNVGISVLMPGMTDTRIVETSYLLRPGDPLASTPEDTQSSDAAQTAQAMRGVLSGAMAPDKSAALTIDAVAHDRFWIMTHPEWKAMAQTLSDDMLAGFDVGADPEYAGDDIAALIRANGGHMFGAATSAAACETEVA